MKNNIALKRFLWSGLLMNMLVGCQPTVKVEAPDKPIEINLNVKIEHHIKVEMERDIRTAMKKNPDIF